MRPAHAVGRTPPVIDNLRTEVFTIILNINCCPVLEINTQARGANVNNCKLFLFFLSRRQMETSPTWTWESWISSLTSSSWTKWTVSARFSIEKLKSNVLFQRISSKRNLKNIKTKMCSAYQVLLKSYSGLLSAQVHVKSHHDFHVQCSSLVQHVYIKKNFFHINIVSLSCLQFTSRPIWRTTSWRRHSKRWECPGTDIRRLTVTDDFSIFTRKLQIRPLFISMTVKIPCNV